jgi:hypothetical protein
MEMNLLIQICSLHKSAACPLISGKLMEIYCKYEVSETLLIAPLHTVFPQGSLIFSGPHKLPMRIKYIRCVIPQSIGLPRQSFRILGPDPQYS